MVNIRITGISSDGLGLILDDNGHTIARGPADVQWEVVTSRVRSIEAITGKNISGSTNVFPSGYPRARNAQKKVWFGKVSRYNSDYVYVYTIRWVKDADGSIHDFDPIISIKPSKFTLTALATIFIGVGISLLFSRKKKSSK